MSTAQDLIDIVSGLSANQRDFTPDFIKSVHNKAYPAIDPTQPHLSARGKTVLVTGGATGIGFEIARSFAAAAASTVVLVARRAATLETASATISKEFPSTQVLTFPTDITDPVSVKQLFESTIAQAKNKAVDILVTSAVYTHSMNPALSVPPSEIQSSFATNLLGNLDLVRNFLSSPSSPDIQKTILDVSTNAVIQAFPTTSAYGASKAAFTSFLRHVQNEHPEIRVHSFHPGAVWTPLVQGFGITRDVISAIESDVQLPGRFAVWLASEEAAFLKGRFLLAKWDVQDLVKNKEVFEKDSLFSVVTLNL